MVLGLALDPSAVRQALKESDRVVYWGPSPTCRPRAGQKGLACGVGQLVEDDFRLPGEDVAGEAANDESGVDHEESAA